MLKPHEARDAEGLVIDMTPDQVRVSDAARMPMPHPDASQAARLQEIWERKTAKVKCTTHNWVIGLAGCTVCGMTAPEAIREIQSRVPEFDPVGIELLAALLSLIPPEQVVGAMGEETRRTIAIHVLRAVDWSELSDEDGNEGTGREAMLVRHTAELRGALTKTERERDEALARAEKTKSRVETPENQEDGHPCEYCGEPCLYGSRHPRCHEKAQLEAVRAMGAAAKSRATALELLDAMDVLVNGEPTFPDRECYCELADDIRRAVAAIPTWQPIADLPKVRTRPVVVCDSKDFCRIHPDDDAETIASVRSWATHFIFAPEEE